MTTSSPRSALLVYAHPEPTSFAAALRQRAERELTEAGWTVEVSDLYAEGFNPVAGPGDFTSPSDPRRLHVQREQAHAASSGTLAPDLLREVERLERADLLVFLAPLWWFGLPAILKGWVDRVFVFGRVYGNGLTFETGPLRGKQAMLALTTGGPESSYSEGGAHGELDVLLHSVHHGMFRFTGMDALDPFVAWGAGWADDATRAAYLDAFGERLAALASADSEAA
ncbi:MAG TPA: NAD(P)H-dependent oxidoreductase [Pedococcus sp.]|nr:NAD(P)H-dependent oxidoreductase [Pedococcus sp.]